MTKIVKTQRNSTQFNATIKQLALELDTVVMCSTTTHPPPLPQTFQPLLDVRELKFGTDTHQTNLIEIT